MDSPLILLIIWALINVFIKSAKDKKNIEEAKSKRTKNLGNQTQLDKQTQYKNRNTTVKNNKKSIIDVFKEEIENEIQRERQKQKPTMTTQIEKSVNAEKIADEKIKYNDVQRDIPVINEVQSKDVVANINNQSKVIDLDLKKDILKGIIYAEILSEPKSIKNMKRSM